MKNLAIYIFLCFFSCALICSNFVTFVKRNDSIYVVSRFELKEIKIKNNSNEYFMFDHTLNNVEKKDDFYFIRLPALTEMEHLKHNSTHINVFFSDTSPISSVNFLKTNAHRQRVFPPTHKLFKKFEAQYEISQEENKKPRFILSLPIKTPSLAIQFEHVKIDYIDDKNKPRSHKYFYYLDFATVMQLKHQKEVAEFQQHRTISVFRTASFENNVTHALPISEPLSLLPENKEELKPVHFTGWLYHPNYMSFSINKNVFTNSPKSTRSVINISKPTINKASILMKKIHQREVKNKDFITEYLEHNNEDSITKKSIEDKVELIQKLKEMLNEQLSKELKKNIYYSIILASLNVNSISNETKLADAKIALKHETNEKRRAFILYAQAIASSHYYGAENDKEILALTHQAIQKSSLLERKQRAQLYYQRAHVGRYYYEKDKNYAQAMNILKDALYYTDCLKNDEIAYLYYNRAIIGDKAYNKDYQKILTLISDALKYKSILQTLPRGNNKLAWLYSQRAFLGSYIYSKDNELLLSFVDDALDYKEQLESTRLAKLYYKRSFLIGHLNKKEYQKVFDCTEKALAHKSSLTSKEKALLYYQQAFNGYYIKAHDDALDLIEEALLHKENLTEPAYSWLNKMHKQLQDKNKPYPKSYYYSTNNKRERGYSNNKNNHNKRMHF